MAHKRKLGYRFESDNPDSMRNAVEVLYRKAVTVPVDVEIEGEQRVLSYDAVKEILMNASRISLLDCVCRTKRHNCDKPIRTIELPGTHLYIGEITGAYVDQDKRQGHIPDLPQAEPFMLIESPPNTYHNLGPPTADAFRVGKKLKQNT